MPYPMEICIEDLDRPDEDQRYMRCVALPGGEPGLALDREGVVRWMPDEPADYGLWVSADDRLVLLRGAGAGPVAVQRGGREVQAPVGQPVILLDQDLLRVNGRRLRVHVHGVAEQIYAPVPLTGSVLGRAARSAATALALAAAVGTGAGAAAAPEAPLPIEVRARPPKPAPRIRQVDCTITAMKTTAKGLKVHASCPPGAKLLAGQEGQIIDAASGGAVENGSVTVTTFNSGKVVGLAPGLKQKVKATTLRFLVRRY